MVFLRWLMLLFYFLYGWLSYVLILLDLDLDLELIVLRVDDLFGRFEQSDCRLRIDLLQDILYLHLLLVVIRFEFVKIYGRLRNKRLMLRV